MARYVAFLRGVSPMNAKMSELKRCFETAGFTNVVTVISSGNVVFDSRSTSESLLERKIEKAFEDHMDRTFVTFVRSIKKLTEMVDADHFGKTIYDTSAKPIITFLREKPDVKIKLPAIFPSGSILDVQSKEVFSVYNPAIKTPNFMAVLEKNFSKVNTTRTLETVKKVILK